MNKLWGFDKISEIITLIDSLGVFHQKNMANQEGKFIYHDFWNIMIKNHFFMYIEV